VAGWIALSDSLIDRNGKPIGTDFSSFYAAGSRVLEGRAADVCNMAAHYARPRLVALAVWQVSSLALYLSVIGGIVARMRGMAVGPVWLPIAAGFPAVFINLGHGQNGFLSAGLFGAALLALPARPILSGVLFGLLAYKPQLALVMPIALLAAGQWRTVIASTEASRKLLLEQGDVGFEKLQSVFAAVRMTRGVASATGVPLGLLVLLTFYVFASRRAVLDRAHSPVGINGIAQA
jgi:hypothetical protein